jgi:serine protease inhibitor
MMRMATLPYTELKDGWLLILPYSGGDFSMVIILPREAATINLLQQEISASKLDAWIGAASERKVEVELPRFRLRASSELSVHLQALGMPTAFGARADFSGIGPARDLRLSKFVHEAYLAVDEKGTEAAAASGAIIAVGSQSAVKFRVNRPFLVAIQHNASRSILFLGRVVNPSPLQ